MTDCVWRVTSPDACITGYYGSGVNSFRRIRKISMSLYSVHGGIINALQHYVYRVRQRNSRIDCYRLAGADVAHI